MADTQERRCQNCDAVLPQTTKQNERRRIWCSERCSRAVRNARRKTKPNWWKVRKCWLCGKKGGGGSGVAGKRSFCSEECREVTKDCERSELVPHSGLTGLAWRDINEKYRGPAEERYAFYSTLATRLRWLLPRTCPDCKKQHIYFGSAARRRCATCHQDRERSQKARHASKRRGAFAGSTVSRELIYDRDHGTCWICTKPTEPWSSWRSRERRLGQDQRWFPTLDHIRPLAKGGEHTAQNIRLAHFICNSMRGHRKSRAQTVRAILG